MWNSCKTLSKATINKMPKTTIHMGMYIIAEYPKPNPWFIGRELLGMNNKRIRNPWKER